MQHGQKDVILDLFPEGIETAAPLNEFPDIHSESELKFNKKKLVKLPSPSDESNKNVNSIEKK